MQSRYESIAVVYGSDSSEWEVSCRSGKFTASQIDGEKWDVYEIFARFGKWELVAYRLKGQERVELQESQRVGVDKNDFSVTLPSGKVKFDYAYIMQHGTPGENGLIQGYFEMLGIPYSSCSSFVSAITFDKFSCKSYLKDVDFVKCAKDIFVRKAEMTPDFAQQAVDKLGLPMFVKPTDSGSSFGVTKVKKIEDFQAAADLAFSEGTTLLAEEAIVGRELQDGVYFNGKEVVALPVIEIVSENEFFDYDAKYNGKSQEICPARITDAERELIQETSKKIYRRLNCSGVVRIDYILSGEDLYFLEINTIPGMTAASLVPQMVRVAGMKITDFLSEIIEPQGL
ncbi:MAG: D-alanine--D-alanine ligase [Bacteroidales bacterium]|nr:D-alanine--D-alanine ligase [Bacteroidales bacterium]